ncbi:MAG TPA: DUF2330 domain-containing protein [Candidatus Nitrosotenuis sp.]|jgi:hypothetical protein|nr:DUF2330 domain-containing protein [Candidatus Nitrosotenuis sp.]
MNRIFLATCLILAALVAAARAGLGCIAIPIQPDVTMSLPEQRAILYREGNKEHLILSIRYQGETREFAWVIPTEGKPTVKTQPGAPFHELWRLTEIARPRVSGAGEGARAPGAVAAPPPVTVLERKIEGPYDLAVLHATSGVGLYRWLRDNGFQLSPASRSALDQYVARRWYFVAARIRPGGQGSEQIARRLKEGTIAALHMTYPATKLSYPLRVTAGNPGMSKMELFVLAANQAPQPGLEANTFQLTPSGSDGFRIQGPPGTVRSEGSFPTLRRLWPQGGTLVKYTGTLSDRQRMRDLDFVTF